MHLEEITDHTQAHKDERNFADHKFTGIGIEITYIVGDSLVLGVNKRAPLMQQCR